MRHLIDSLKHAIRDAYRQHYLSSASKRRQDCQGQTTPIDVSLTRSFFLSQNNPLHQPILRHVLTGSLDHTQRLSNLILLLAPLALSVKNKMKQLNMFFGIVLGGRKDVLDTPL